jgi:hypothetical protein
MHIFSNSSSSRVRLIFLSVTRPARPAVTTTWLKIVFVVTAVGATDAVTDRLTFSLVTKQARYWHDACPAGFLASGMTGTDLRSGRAVAI